MSAVRGDLLAFALLSALVLLSPVVYDVAGTRQLVVWHPEAVNGLDPATGNVYWSVPFKVKANLTVAMPATGEGS